MNNVNLEGLEKISEESTWTYQWWLWKNEGKPELNSREILIKCEEKWTNYAILTMK
jgi:hypothetical protein